MAEVATALAHREAVATLRERLAPYVALCRFNLATMEGSIAHQVGVLDAFLGDIAAAEEHLREALARHEEWRSPYLIARTQLALAEVLAQAGRLDAARDLVGRAAVTAATHGYARLAVLARRASVPPDH